MNADNVNPKHEQAILALLAEPSVAKAAATCDVSEGTLYNWLRDPNFRRAFSAARRDAFSQAIGLLQRYAVMAAQSLAKVMVDPAAPSSSKVSAASAVLKHGREGIELDDLVVRIEAVEKVQAEQPKR